MSDLDEVKKRLEETGASLVVMFSDGIIKEYYNPRVEDIVAILKSDKYALKNAIIADKVIGKIAGSLLAFGGVKEIYANTISKIAIPVLEKNKIKYEYSMLVDYIQNNDKTGICPMENRFKNVENLTEIYNYFVKNNETSS